MQQFTRALIREIEAGGERLVVTLSKQGLSVRPIAGRRPPYTMSWEACLVACVAGGGQEPAADQLANSLQAIRAGAPKLEEKAAPSHSTTETASAPSPPAVPTSHSVPATGADKVTVLLSRLDHWLSNHRERFHQALQPGATAAECDELSAMLGRPLPEELRALLMWHNGQNPDVPGAFEQNWILMSTQEIADAKKDLDDQLHAGWQKHWMPFLDDDNGDYLCLDLDTPGCSVLECWRGRSDHPVVAPSLASWLEAFVNALERGDYVEDPERGSLVLRS